MCPLGAYAKGSMCPRAIQVAVSTNCMGALWTRVNLAIGASMVNGHRCLVGEYQDGDGGPVGASHLACYLREHI